MRKRVGQVCIGIAFGSMAAGAGADAQFPQGKFIVPPDPGVRVVIGAPDFEKLHGFPKRSDEWQLGRKIAFLKIGGISSCSGSLVGPDLLLTNQHCTVPDGPVVPPEDIVVFMEYYEEGKAGRPGARGAEYLRSSEALDYALVRLDRALGDEYGWLNLDPSGVEATRAVRLLGHPRGRSKEIVRRNTRVVRVHPKHHVVHYLADSEPGSSGSPVLAADGETVIALHHVGTPEYNEGVLIGPILGEIGRWLPGAPAIASGAGELPEPWRRLIDSIAGAAPLQFAANQERYRVGEEMQLILELPRVGYVNVIAVDEQGEATVLYPNRYARDNYRPQEPFVLPAAGMPFAFTASPPAGRQLLVSILTDEPLNFFDRGSHAAEAVFAALDGRGLDDFSRSSREAGAHAAYEITVIED